ncbi:MAG: hypothetical protein VX621_03680 [Candidatus Thermoplasmatota archaeon]|nr:hypothetical protein [Candidatus Thermoplasmatota archaeon]
MAQNPEKWWEITTDEAGQGDTEAPQPIQITGDEGVTEPQEHEFGQEGDAGLEKGPTEWTQYSKQKASAIGIYLFTFLFGDWWWDGSNGFAALFWSIDAILAWPDTYAWLVELDSTSTASVNPPLNMLAWALWDVTPLVFFATFLSGSNLLVSRNLKLDSPEIRDRGKKAHRNLKYFVFALILMDLITYTIYAGLPILEYPVRFFEIRPGIYWMFIAFGASYGLNPRTKKIQTNS